MTDIQITPPKPETLDKIRAGDPEMMRKLLARTWLEQQGDTSLPHAVEGSRIRHSWAGCCARQLRYRIDGVEPSNPPDVAAQWVFRLGHLIHDEWQGALLAAFPEKCHIEVKYPNVEIDGSFTLDAEIGWPDETDPDGGFSQAVEIKSIGGYGFKMMNGARGKDGPRHSALLQLALNANATPGCTGGWMIYVAAENTSIGEAERKNLGVLDRFMLVTYYPVEELRPLAELEERRMNQVKAESDDSNMVDPEGNQRYRKTARVIPDPEIPAGAVIIDPSKGQWAVLDADGEIKDTGKTWHCHGYCDYESKCIEDGV